MSTNISPKTYFRLTNSENGPDFALAVVPGSPELKLRVASSDGSKLWWLFYPTSDPNEYNICTTYNLETYCLDILGGDNAKATPHLSTISFVKGQLWTLNPAGGTLYKLSNDYSQNGYFLDTISGSNDSVMTKGNSPGQYWSLNAREWISSVNRVYWLLYSEDRLTMSYSRLQLRMLSPRFTQPRSRLRRQLRIHARIRARLLKH